MCLHLTYQKPKASQLIFCALRSCGGYTVKCINNNSQVQSNIIRNATKRDAAILHLIMVNELNELDEME